MIIKEIKLKASCQHCLKRRIRTFQYDALNRQIYKCYDCKKIFVIGQFNNIEEPKTDISLDIKQNKCPNSKYDTR